MQVRHFIDVKAPAPWTLTGDGYILLYKFPRKFAEAHSYFGDYKGGLGAVMLVDYHTSDVGPYREVLFSPGRIAYPGRPVRTGYSISRIYVDSIPSVINGQDNWGIPKEFAEFDVRRIDRGVERIRIYRDQQRFLDITLQTGGWRLPVNAALMPAIVQQRRGRTFVTKLRAAGRAQFVRVLNFQIESDLFPPVHQFRPLLAMRITGFKMTFPVPEML